ncbi:hypothetical protein [Nocardioides sp. zg-DK7169]|uniref:hypothetical protein n=1 Tax=Nocardioides sp. zg-DK7169 TaxID=2736600 RepID=UPI00155605F9|nr:hypothetical protein [Nocardioides sp. zg-DK7169]NPC98836.1 hypothetical protein [Nocardioides sp. zg-DK7169]
MNGGAPVGGPAQAAVERVLARSALLHDRARALDRAGHGDPVVRAALRAALHEATGPQAPLVPRTVGDRVRRGTLTWDRVWEEPQEVGPEAVLVVRRALAALARSARRQGLGS